MSYGFSRSVVKLHQMTMQRASVVCHNAFATLRGRGTCIPRHVRAAFLLVCTLTRTLVPVGCCPKQIDGILIGLLRLSVREILSNVRKAFRNVGVFLC